MLDSLTRTVDIALSEKEQDMRFGNLECPQQKGKCQGLFYGECEKDYENCPYRRK